MPTYEYENDQGTRRTIVAPMKDSPPERVHFNDDGTWCGMEHCSITPRPDHIFHRIYSTSHAYARNWTTWRSPISGGKIMDL